MCNECVKYGLYKFDEDFMGVNPELEQPIDDQQFGPYEQGLASDLLTHEEAMGLLTTIQMGLAAQEQIEEMGEVDEHLMPLVEEGMSVMEFFIGANMGLVHNVAKKYPETEGLGYDDLIQAGRLGMVKAIKNFDVARGNTFSTYAMWLIKQAIDREYMEMNRTQRLPVYLVAEMRKLERVTREFHQTMGEMPSVDDLAVALGVDPSRVIELQRLSSNRAARLDQPISNLDNAPTIGEMAGDSMTPKPEEVVEHLSFHQRMLEVLKELP